jgi:hypothetical protein
MPCGEQKDRIRDMNPWKTVIAILATLSASLALGDDIKTNSGKEYKNATVSRVEADGLMIKFSGRTCKNSVY